MKDFKDFYQIVREDATTVGQRPRIRDYLALKLAENVFAILLVVLTLSFAAYGLFLTEDATKVQWALNAGSLTLGVFLGLFAGKRLK